MKQKMMIYHAITTGLTLAGVTENVWGHNMLTKTIDAGDKEAVDEAKAEGWVKSPAEVIEQIEAQKMQQENAVMKGQIAGFDFKKKIADLEQQNADLKNQVKKLTAELAVYQKSQDSDKDGKVDFKEMTNDQLKAYLDDKKIEYTTRTTKDELVKLAESAK